MGFTALSNFIKRQIYSPITYHRKQGVKIGKNCNLKFMHVGGEPFLITIGDNAHITDNVHFFTHGGGWVLRDKFPDFDFFGKIVIEDNVYIGSGAYIMPGVTIKSNVFVGARSVVTKSIPEGVIVAGNPAKIIGTVEDFKKRIEKYNMKTKGLDGEAKKEKILNSPESLFLKKDFLKK